MAKAPLQGNTSSMLHLLHRASQRSEEMFVRAVGHNELTARQIIVLDAVAKEDKPSQTMICARSGIDRSTLADIVRRLVSRGLLARRRTKEDARRYAVRLTDEGRRTLERALPVMNDVDKRLMGMLPPTQRQEFLNALQKIVEITEGEGSR